MLQTRNSGSASLWIASLLVAGAIGSLVVVKIIRPDPERIQAEFSEKLSQLDRHPPGDPIGRDRMAEELLAEPEYKEFAAVLYRQLERLHAKLHESALLEREALVEVPAFLARSGTIAERKPGELMELEDTARALLQRYGASSFGRELTRLRDEVRARLEALPSAGEAEREWIQVTVEVRKRAQEGDFDGALGLLSDFERKPAATALTDLPRKGVEQRELVNRLAEAAARSAIRKAKELLEGGATREATLLIERTLGRMADLPAAALLRDSRARLR